MTPREKALEEALRWYATVPRDDDGATMPLDLGERARSALAEPAPVLERVEFAIRSKDGKAWGCVVGFGEACSAADHQIDRSLFDTRSDAESWLGPKARQLPAESFEVIEVFTYREGPDHGE